jgi:hypothetical protein
MPPFNGNLREIDFLMADALLAFFGYFYLNQIR